MIVTLPGNRRIVLDSKVPLSAYLEAIESKDDAVSEQKLKDHAGQVRSHVTALSKKNYCEHIQPSPDFVILFLPGELFFSAALQHDPRLIEDGAALNVIIATPSTLIALLRTIEFGWRQDALATNAQEISDLGRELYQRMSKMGGHLEKIGTTLNGAVLAYNSTIGSLERRVFPCARKFKELKAGAENIDIELLEPIAVSTKALSASELLVNSAVPDSQVDDLLYINDFREV